MNLTGGERLTHIAEEFIGKRWLYQKKAPDQLLFWASLRKVVEGKAS